MKRIFIIILAVVLLLAGYAYFIEPNWIEVKHIDVPTPKLKDSTFTLVQISDLHCYKNKGNEARMVKVVNALRPDIIVFTGDALGEHGGLELFRDSMAALEAKLAKIAVRGNWDSWYWKDIDIFKGTGFEVLTNSSTTVVKGRDKVVVFGLDWDTRKEGKSLLTRAKGEDFNLFLYHYPDFANEVKDFPLDIYLCGHTHGGQIALPFYGAIITLCETGKKYESGPHYLNDKILLYTNRGLGGEGKGFFHMRFFARPEITVFTIHPAG